MRSVTVQIAGQKYTLRTDTDEEYIAELARYVDQKIEEAKRVTRTVSTHQVVILAALTIADELLRVRRETESLKKRVRERAQWLLQYMDEEARASEETRGSKERTQTNGFSPCRARDGVNGEPNTSGKGDTGQAVVSGPSGRSA